MPPPEPAFAPPPRRRARVPLTPLIDVVFILLVFFMLATSFADERRLPLGGAPGPAPAAVSQLLVRAGEAVFEGAAMPLPQAVAAAAARAAASPGRLIVVEAGRDAPLQALVEAVAALRAAGVADVALARP